jgi:hypothetical protein
MELVISLTWATVLQVVRCWDDLYAHLEYSKCSWSVWYILFLWTTLHPSVWQSSAHCLCLARRWTFGVLDTEEWWPRSDILDMSRSRFPARMRVSTMMWGSRAKPRQSEFSLCLDSTCGESARNLLQLFTATWIHYSKIKGTEKEACFWTYIYAVPLPIFLKI